MTVGTNSLPFPVSGPAPCPTAKALNVQTPSSTADAEARRLANAVGRGDEDAFRKLYDRYQERLFRFALALSHGDESLAGEAVQSAFVTAAGKLRDVENEEHLWHWLARVARQQLGKTWRQQRKDPPVVSVANLPECADARESDPVLEEKLDAALLAMEADERQLIEWFYFDGLSHKEIAGKLSATPKAVSSRLERARSRLRGLLANTSFHET
jgi:RNA polymerase sigma-70 factor (ECF subfamily)